jgi:hypothetical protein
LYLYHTLDNEASDFNHPRIYAALKTLFGESTTMYDDYKCSFGYTFLLDINKKGKTSKYTLNFTDLKGGLTFYFQKVLADDELGKYDRGILHKPFDDEFSKDEMRWFKSYFTFFLVGFWDSYGPKYDEEYFRTLSDRYVYGYVDGEFFLESYEEHDDFLHAVEALKKKNIPCNEVKPNP